METLDKILNYNDKTVKVVGTDKEPWFCGKDVCDILRYSKYRDALAAHVEQDCKKELSKVVVQSNWTTTFDYNEGKMAYINEEGLYSLIFACKLPIAKAFKRWVMRDVLPSIRKSGEYKFKEVSSKLIESMSLLAIKDTELETERERSERERRRADDACFKLRSETKRLQQQIKRTLEFNQATKHIEPLEYIYINTTEHYQRQHKFKVGGVQNFDLLKSRLTQYNSGESNSDSHFFVYVRKTVSYRAVEQAIKGVLSGFRENQSNELYIIHYDWLLKFVDAILDGNAEFALFVNCNREQVARDTINKEPTIVPPIQLEQITYLRAGDSPRDLTAVLPPETIQAIREAIESFSPDNNTVRRKEFENHLLRHSPSLKLEGKKRDAWELTRTIGSSVNPMWRYKY
ncbi:BRO-like protein, GIY-YIG domain [Armadillidium vulgare iridescent virus]|uniref:BRO-like protein, GIY-YIG domain n=1 Tax=Armadillidium vulgare iridescent virus TaxID=72201 RepID=A0A068QL34_9VIRU|nr:BRO-like protein, GIY-YIG domain [Armadillidium vulgare iridescent virus]CCV02425.1 BRO-like protein, GIY-YIG domain [Armadillidium vulgare iridescent virus]